MTIECNICQGNGGWDTLICDIVLGDDYQWKPCDECNQTGYVEEKCWVCEGQGSFYGGERGETFETCTECGGIGWT